MEGQVEVGRLGGFREQAWQFGEAATGAGWWVLRELAISKIWAELGSDGGLGQRCRWLPVVLGYWGSLGEVLRGVSQGLGLAIVFFLAVAVLDLVLKGEPQSCCG